MIWCNTHRRPYQLCLDGRGGILLPCKPIDLTDILEIEYMEKDENGVPSIYLDGKFTEWELIEFIDRLRTFRETKPKLSQIRENLEKKYPEAFKDDPMKNYSPLVIAETIARAKANGVI